MGVSLKLKVVYQRIVWKQPGNLPILRNIVVENNEKVELEGHKGESPQERILFLLKGKRNRSDKRLKIQGLYKI